MILPLVFLFGCGPKLPDGMPKLYSPIKITVTQEGQPLVGATVTLRSTDPSAGTWTIGGLTDANGGFELYTHGYRGAPLGTFKVVVYKWEEDHDAAKTWSYAEDEYGDAKTTPLEVEITARTRTLTVDAGSAVKISKPYAR